MPCKHEDFYVTANVVRLEDTGRFQMDVTVKCTQCGTPFRFVGLPAGLDLNGAATSVNGEEGRFAIAPRGEVLSIIDGDVPAGFTVRRK